MSSPGVMLPLSPPSSIPRSRSRKRRKPYRSSLELLEADEGEGEVHDDDNSAAPATSGGPSSRPRQGRRTSPLRRARRGRRKPKERKEREVGRRASVPAKTSAPPSARRTRDRPASPARSTEAERHRFAPDAVSFSPIDYRPENDARNDDIVNDVAAPMLRSYAEQWKNIPPNISPRKIDEEGGRAKHARDSGGAATSDVDHWDDPSESVVSTSSRSDDEERSAGEDEHRNGSRQLITEADHVDRAPARQNGLRPFNSGESDVLTPSLAIDADLSLEYGRLVLWKQELERRMRIYKNDILFNHPPGGHDIDDFGKAAEAGAGPLPADEVAFGEMVFRRRMVERRLSEIDGGRRGAGEGGTENCGIPRWLEGGIRGCMGAPPDPGDEQMPWLEYGRWALRQELERKMQHNSLMYDPRVATGPGATRDGAGGEDKDIVGKVAVHGDECLPERDLAHVSEGKGGGRGEGVGDADFGNFWGGGPLNGGIQSCLGAPTDSRNRHMQGEHGQEHIPDETYIFEGNPSPNPLSARGKRGRSSRGHQGREHRPKEKHAFRGNNVRLHPSPKRKKTRKRRVVETFTRVTHEESEEEGSSSLGHGR